VAVPVPGLVTITDRQLNRVALTDAARALVMLADRQVSHEALSDAQRALVLHLAQAECRPVLPALTGENGAALCCLARARCGLVLWARGCHCSGQDVADGLGGAVGGVE